MIEESSGCWSEFSYLVGSDATIHERFSNFDLGDEMGELKLVVLERSDG